jgi:hypothetical protein
MRGILAGLIALAALPAAALVRGRVVTPQGKPVAKAQVTARRRVSADWTRPSQIVATGLSDEKGSFSLDVPGYGVAEIRVLAGDLVLTGTMAAEDDDVGELILAAKVKNGQSPIDVFVTTGTMETRESSEEPPDGVVVSGTLRDPEGHPLTGVAFSVSRKSDDLHWNLVTAADGTFRVSVPAGGGPLLIHRVEPAPVYAVDERRLERIDPDVPIDLVARKRPMLAGLVTSHDGKPVAHASIRFAGEASNSPEAVARIESDAEGRFRLRPPMPEKKMAVRLEAFKQGLPLGTSGELQEGVRTVTITIPKGEPVAGIVSDGEGKPVAGVKVSLSTNLSPWNLWLRRGESDGWSVTGEDGRFAGRLVAGSVALQFEKEGHSREHLAVEVTPGMKALAVKLPRLVFRNVRGRVTDSKGAPVVTFEIEEVTRDFDIRPSPGRAPIVSPTGEFSMELRDKVESIRIQAGGYVAQVVPVPTVAEPLLITLVRGRTIRGHARNEKGEPLGQVSVSVSTSDTGMAGALSEDDGAYELLGVDPGVPINLRFNRADYIDALEKVDAGKDDAIVDVILSAGLVLTGRLLDADGTPLADQEVRAESAGHPPSNDVAMTNEAGQFRFSRLTPARWDFTVELENAGERAAVRDVDVEKIRELTIRCERIPTGTIRGHVSGVALARGVMVTATSADGAYRLVDVNAAGDYTMDHAPAGSIEVRAEEMSLPSMRSSRHVSIELPPGGESRVDLEFAKQVAVRGRVTRGGAPWEGVEVVIGESRVISQAGGSYRLEVDPGEHQVWLMEKGRPLPFKKHVVVDGETELDLAFDAASVAVTVLDDETSQPLAGATVGATVMGEASGMVEALTAGDGRAQLLIPRDRPYTISAAQPGFGNASFELKTDAPPAVVLRLVRSAGAVVRLIDARDGRTLGGYAVAHLGGRVLASANEPDADGTSTLPVPPGTYQFSGSAEGYASHTVTATVPSGEVRIALPRGGSLMLRAKGALHGKARLLESDGSEYVRCWCNGIAAIEIDGASTLIDRVAPGPYTLEVTLAGASPRRIPVTVIEGVTTTVALE